MIRAGSPARTIMRTLRTGLSQPPGSDLSPLLPLAKQALAFIDRGAADDPATAGEASELAFLLAALLEAGDENFRLQALRLLFRLGVEGEVLAVIHLEKLPEDQALVILGNLSDEEKLLFANAFFRRPRFHRPRTGAFGLETLSDVVEKNPDELLILLDLLANRHEYPALPLRNALVRGRLGMWLRRLLQMDLSAEQTRYMARVAGRLRDPGLTDKLAVRLGDMDDLSAEAVCRALADSPGLDATLVVPPLRALVAATTEPSLLAAALNALARCDTAGAASVAAELCTAQPGNLGALVPVLAGLDLAGFGACLRALPPPMRRDALVTTYAFLASALPERVRMAARTVLAAGAFTADLGAALQADLNRRARAQARPATTPEADSPQAEPKETATGLWKRVKSLVTAQPPAGEDAPTTALRQELAAGGIVRDRQILWKELEAAQLANVSVTRCNFKAVNLAQSQMVATVFTDCQFSDVSMEQAVLENVTFTGCRFSNCRFAKTRFDTVRFADCDLRLCGFETITAQDMTFAVVEAMECDFFMASLTSLTLEQVRFRAVSLVRAGIRDLTIRGGLFSDCLFEMAAISGTNLAGVRTEGCYFAGARFACPTDEPDILGAMGKDEAGRLAETEHIASLPAILTAGPGLRLVASVVDALLFSRDIRRRRLAMLANNKRRLAWARRRLESAGAALLDMLPGLVAAGWVQADGKTRPAPAARIHGLAPDLPTARNLAGYFGLPMAQVLEIPETALDVEAVYTIGSAGTVAQTRDSDLDIWVCLTEASAKRPEIPAFTAKLEAITARAARDYDLEIHFFLMTQQDIRDNVFGYSEDEGYGSAQGCLLKEECYRTALVLAGRKPAWWYVAPRMTAEAYAKAMAGLGRAEPDAAADSLDLGCVTAIAADAFFGASLWMIVKSLTSPFKAVIKFGLLEKYAAEEGEPALLCETLKEAIFSNQGGLWRCDPYALLFSEVSRHYRQRESSGTLELLRQAFLQKTGFDPCEEFLTRSGEALLDHFFPYAAPASGQCLPPPKRESAEADAGFAQTLALGEAITTYLLRAYDRLKQHATGLTQSGDLSERDQIMLSRRIGVSFSRRVGKIMRLPSIRPSRDLFTGLEFAYEDVRAKDKDKEMVYAVRGESLSADRKSRRKELVRQESSLVRLAAWLVANELYRPGQFLQAGNLPAPLTVPDLTGLLDALFARFPAGPTFGPPLSWGLEPERVTAAVLVCNLSVPREEKRNLSVDVLYATSWGELFHQERNANLEALADSPASYLTHGLGLTLASGVDVSVFAPARSQCQAARMARRG